MKITSVAISNLYSFPHIDNFESEHEPIIEFNDDLNILIGPNGSGKSNFMEILNEIFQETFVGNKVVAPYPSRHIGSDSLLHNPNKHNNHKEDNKHSQMLIKIELSDIDKKNIKTIINNIDDPKLTDLLIPHRHYDNNFHILGDWLNGVKNSNDVIDDIQSSLNCFVDMDKKQPIATHTNMTPIDYFIYTCLIHFKFLQKIVEEINIDNKKDWQPVQNTFLLISSERKYSFNNQTITYGAGIETTIDRKQDELHKNNSAKNDSSTDSLFETVLSKWGKIIRDKRNESGTKCAQTEINKHIASISDILNNSIGLSIKINVGDNDTSNLVIFDNGKPVIFNSLSTGQKSIFYLIFSIYGLELENALVLIDEPELHLHPALQKKYFELLKKARKKRNLQIILSTHSPVFIDEETIKSTFRFYKKDDDTKIIIPEIKKNSKKDDDTNIKEIKELFQILTYTNSARIFFANRVVLVEGASDEYFFKFFYDNYFLKHHNTNESVEIIHITGKKQFEKWREFLKKFGIKNYFIGDFDNVEDFKLIENYDDIIKQGKTIILKKMREKIKDKTSDDGKAVLEHLDQLISNNFEITNEAKSELISLWNYLLRKHSTGALKVYYEEHPDELNTSHQKIEEKYKDGIYILKQGDLEEYLGITKDMQNVIGFCKNDDFAKIESSKLNELEGIFKHILEIK